MKLLSILLISLTLASAQDAEVVTTLSNNIQQPDFNSESNSLDRSVETVGDGPDNETRMIGKSTTAVRRLLDNGVTVENDGRIQLGTCKPSLTTEVTYVNHPVNHTISEIHLYPTTIIETSTETFHTTFSSTTTVVDLLTKSHTETETKFITNTVQQVLRFTELIPTTITVIEPKTVVETILQVSHTTNLVTISEFVTEVITETSTNSETTEVTEIETELHTKIVTLNNIQHFTTHGTHFLQQHETSTIPTVFTVTHHRQTFSTYCDPKTTKTMKM